MESSLPMLTSGVTALVAPLMNERDRQIEVLTQGLRDLENEHGAAK